MAGGAGARRRARWPGGGGGGGGGGRLGRGGRRRDAGRRGRGRRRLVARVRRLRRPVDAEIAGLEEAKQPRHDLLARPVLLRDRRLEQRLLERADGEGGEELGVARRDDALALPLGEARRHERLHPVVEGADLRGERRIEPGRVGEENLGERRILEEHREDGTDVVLDLSLDVDARVDGEDGAAEAPEEHVDELGEDRSLVREVEVEGPLRDLGRRDDVVDLRLVVALRREDVARRRHELKPARRLVHARPVIPPGCPGPKRGVRGGGAPRPPVALQLIWSLEPGTPAD